MSLSKRCRPFCADAPAANPQKTSPTRAATTNRIPAPIQRTCPEVLWRFISQATSKGYAYRRSRHTRLSRRSILNTRKWPYAQTPAIGASLFAWGVEYAVDLHDIVVEQALDLDHRAGWIGRLAPQLGLGFFHHGGEPVQVADVDRESHAILQAGALRLGNQPDVEECLANSSLGVLHQRVGRRIDALHASDEDEVTGPRAEAPGSLRLDGTGRTERFHAIGRG